MNIPCGYCRNAFPRLRLHRVGNRLLCRRCFRAIQQAPAGGTGSGTGPGVHTGAGDLTGALQHNLHATLRAVAGKAALFVPLFFWARHGELGAAALRGAVAADVFTWIVLSLIEWPFRRLHVGVGLFFELALIGLYVNRGPLFDIGGDGETTALSMLFFLLVLIGKTALWTVQHVLEVNGVTEPA